MDGSGRFLLGKVTEGLKERRFSAWNFRENDCNGRETINLFNSINWFAKSIIVWLNYGDVRNSDDSGLNYWVSALFAQFSRDLNFNYGDRRNYLIKDQFSFIRQCTFSDIIVSMYAMLYFFQCKERDLRMKNNTALRTWKNHDVVKYHDRKQGRRLTV